ncbi:TetR/AcrR family transcriptional regulator [Microvirga puerhi]|uniref:TetR/AcrR family transcriptional regulator n=1 Tax=Microvirga puerhi TaxID=2876078 RepID=A0ABS7VP23_9HYPH|nr:TetR/AcrR family transcriptional regulator [Microvirga puerhi]MBZ6077291.1 TetR/AcrR family transcriptional regulator [Microvirga puerhi]
MAKSDGQGRTNDPEGFRRKVLDTAYAAFCTHGYAATSMHDLKRDAGASGGALSHHFPTKKDLALAVLEHRVADAVEETWISPVRTAAAAAEGIQAVFNSIATELEERGAVSGCPLNNLALELSRQDEDFRAAIDAIFVRWRWAIADRIRADQGQGRLISLDAEETATFVVAAYSGSMAMAKASQSAVPLRACAAMLDRTLRDASA